MSDKAINEKTRKLFTERFNELLVGKTQEEFATLTGLARPTVGLYASGKRIADTETLLKIARSCKVSTDWLLGESDTSNPKLEIQAITRETGLSQAAINNVRILHGALEIVSLRYDEDADSVSKVQAYPFNEIDILSRLLEQERFQSLLNDIMQFIIFSCGIQEYGEQPTWLSDEPDPAFPELEALRERKFDLTFCKDRDAAMIKIINKAESMMMAWHSTVLRRDEAAEVYLQRACDTLREIVKSISSDEAGREEAREQDKRDEHRQKYILTLSGAEREAWQKEFDEEKKTRRCAERKNRKAGKPDA